MRFYRRLVYTIAIPFVFLLAGCNNSTDPVKSDAAPPGTSTVGAKSTPATGGNGKAGTQSAPSPPPE